MYVFATGVRINICLAGCLQGCYLATQNVCLYSKLGFIFLRQHAHQCKPWTISLCAVADLHHDSFYDELPASVRTEVALEITNQVFEESSLLSVLVPFPLLSPLMVFFHLLWSSLMVFSPLVVFFHLWWSSFTSCAFCILSMQSMFGNSCAPCCQVW